MTIGHDSQTAGIQSAAPNRKQKFLVVNNGIAESKKKEVELTTLKATDLLQSMKHTEAIICFVLWISV